jgi:hypothetical protein
MRSSTTIIEIDHACSLREKRGGEGKASNRFAR